MGNTATAQLLSVTTVSPRTELTAPVTRTSPADGEDLTQIKDTIEFPSGANYIKLNNTEKLKYKWLTNDNNDIKFGDIERGVIADLLIGFYCGDGISPKTNIPQLQPQVGVHNPIYNVINYQAAIETGLDAYDWYDWLYERGMYLQLAYEPKNPAKDYDDQPEWALDTYVGGSHDADFDRWAASIKTFCETNGYIIYIRPMSEMNGDWTVWGDGVYAGNTPANYRAAWQHLWNRMEAGGANPYLKWVWCPVAPLSAADADTCWTDYYPGDAYVDIIGMNGYNFGAISWSYWRTFSEIFTHGYSKFSTASGKDLYICEIGCNSTGGNKPTWIEDAFYQLQNNFTRFVAVTWFNMKEPSDSSIDYRFTETPITTRAFAKNAFWRRQCAWCGTSDCIHRVFHNTKSPVWGLGDKPPTADPITEKVATISIDGDILTNVPIDGNYWMYFENRSYVEDNIWVFVNMPRPQTSKMIYEGDILRLNLSHILD